MIINGFKIGAKNLQFIFLHCKDYMHILM